MTLVEHVDRLRELVQADRDSTIFQLVLLNIVEEIAVEVDRLVASHPPPEPERGFGSI